MLFSQQKMDMLTFPGVILHELVHAIMCKVFGIQIQEICYLRYGKPSGYIVHSACNSFISQFCITVGPLLINTVLGGYLGYKYMYLHPDAPTFDRVFFLWLAVSFLVHSFPSVQDVKNFHKVLKKESELIQLLNMPILICLYVIGHSAYFWVELGYAWLVVFQLPLYLQKHNIKIVGSLF